MDLRSRFGFHCLPFTRELATTNGFRTSPFDETLGAIERAIAGRHSAALIAPAGTGKTFLVRTLCEQLPEVCYDLRYVKTTTLARRDMCREIAMALSCKPAGNYPTLVRRVQERFESTLETEGLRPVLILDDAHEMKPETLGLLKVLTNFAMDSKLVVSILLIGQPHLRRLLQRPELEDVARRLTHYAELRLLSREESRRYVEHRCKTAGATTVPFDDRAFDTLYELSRGNLRAIDRLALKALELADQADQTVVGTAHLTKARGSLWP